MRVAFVFILIAFLAPALKAQVVERKVNSYMDSLRAKGIDTFLIYSFYSSGRRPAVDPCDSENNQYLFWISDRQSFVNKFEKCSNHKPVILANVSPVSFYAANKSWLEKEKVETPTQLIKGKGGKPKEVSLKVSHSYFHRFKFINQDSSTQKVVSDFDLNFDTFDDGEPNIYHKQNQSTKLKKLIEMTEKAVKK